MSHVDFPAWISATHFLNIIFMVLLARSGIQILASFPRLYLKDDCAPGHEVLKFTSKKIPRDRPYQSLDEEADVSPLLALPGGRGAKGGLGVGRHWHLLALMGWVATGAVYIVLLFATDEWRRLIPTSWSVFPGALAAAETYMHLQLAEPPSGMPYNPLQQLAYFGVVFLLAPLQIATGAAMSPAVAGRFPWFPRIFGSRQAARTIHFAGLCAFFAFVLVHTAMVVAHGVPKEFGRIALASDRADPTAAVIAGLIGLGTVLVIAVAANVQGSRDPRRTQLILGRVVDRLQSAVSLRLQSRQRYKPGDITSYFWINGYPPQGPLYRKLASNGFADWKLKVRGLVERPFEVSLDGLRTLPRHTQITKHDCIQGWTGVAEWSGVNLSDFIDLCRVLPEARFVVFHAFDDKGVTQSESEGFYYEAIDLRLARGPQSLLAYEFNGRPLPIEHGAPLRLRVENQLGFKMVKWIKTVSFEKDYRDIGLGYGGWREDHAYYGRVVGI